MSANPWRSEVARFTGKSLPYALVAAINATLEQAQKEQRAGMRRRFTIRRPAFADRSVKIPRGGFATVRKLVGEIRIAGPAGRSGTSPFVEHEANRTKTPQAGGRSIAIPIAARRSKAGIVQASQRPAALLANAAAKAGASGFGRVWIDRDTATGHAAIIRRVGRGRRGKIETVYALRPSVRVPKRLGFRETVTGVVARQLRQRITAAIAKEASTYKPRGAK